MSNLIEELKKEHLEIIDTIQSAFDKGLLHEGRDVLLSAKNMLISHIKKEDKDLYTHLRENAEQYIVLFNKHKRQVQIICERY